MGHKRLNKEHKRLNKGTQKTQQRDNFAKELNASQMSSNEPVESQMNKRSGFATSA